MAEKPTRTHTPQQKGPGDGEKGDGRVKAKYPPEKLPTPSEEIEPTQHGHSESINWPPAGGPDDAKPPFKGLK